MATRFARLHGEFLDPSLRQGKYPHVSITLFTGDPLVPGVTVEGAVVKRYDKYVDCPEFYVELPINDDITNVAGTYYVGSVDITEWKFHLLAANADQTYEWGDPALNYFPSTDPTPAGVLLESMIGQPNGIAGLDSDGLVPLDQLPIDLGGGGGSGGVSLASFNAHVTSPTPHPAYDVDMSDLSTLFENGLI